MKQPLVPISFALAAGIGLAEFIQVPLIVLFGCAIGLFLTYWRFPQFRAATLLTMVLLAGVIRGIESAAPISPQDIRLQVTELPAVVTVRGILSESPIVRREVYRGNPRVRSQVSMCLSEQLVEDQWVSVTGNVQAALPGTLGLEYFRGQSVEVTGVLQVPRGSEAEGLFDPATFLKHQGIHRQLITEGMTEWRLGPDRETDPPLSERFLPWAQTVLARGLPSDDEALGLLWAMALGWKTGLTSDLREPFLQSGTIHVFAISGLHIALISMVIVAGLRLLRIGRVWCGAITLPLTWFYVAATGWQPSAVRSAVMMTAIVGGWTLSRPSDLMNSLAGAALAILIWEPGQLFLPGFQLSFGVVCSMGLFGERIRWLWNRWVHFDPLLPEELRPKWQRWLRQPLEWLGMNLATAVAAWLGSLPLIWHYFHLINPISLLANLGVVPLSAAALISCLASLICGDWLPWLGRVFNASAWVWMHGMIMVSQTVAKIPGGWRYVTPTPPWFWLGYYFVVWTVYRNWPRRPDRRLWFMCGATLWLGSLLTAAWIHESRLRMTILSGGTTTWVDSPGAKNDLLINTSDETSVRFLTIPFLQAQGVDRLGTLVIGQGDARHSGGALDLMERMHPVRVWYPSVQGRSPVWKRLQSALAQNSGSAEPWGAGESRSGWTALHPELGDIGRTGDDLALVLQSEWGGIRVLLCHDLSRTGQQKLLDRRGPELESDIIIAGVPKEGEPLSDGLLDAVQPQLMILATSSYPASERLKPDLRERLMRRGCPVLDMHQCGTVTLEWNGPGECEIRTHRSRQVLLVRPKPEVYREPPRSLSAR